MESDQEEEGGGVGNGMNVPDTDLEEKVVDSWWSKLSDLVRSCNTTGRLRVLELGKEGLMDGRFWTINAMADSLCHGDSKIRNTLLHFIVEDVIALQVFMQTMQKFDAASPSTSRVMREIVNPKTAGKLRYVVIKQAISVNYLPQSIKILTHLLEQVGQSKFPQDIETLENILTDFVWFLSAVATNDSSFALNVRELLKVKFFHGEVFKKLFFAKSSAHYPLLKILRQLSRNESSASTLLQDGIMNTVRKCFTKLGKASCGKLLILVDVLSQLMKRKRSCQLFMKAGLVAKLVQCFSSWDRWRGKGLYRLGKCVVSVFTQISKRRGGRQAIIKSDVLSHLRRLCDSCPSDKIYDDLIMRIGMLFATCYKKDQLPLKPIESPIAFKFDSSLSDGFANRLQDFEGSSDDDEGDQDEEDGSESDQEETVSSSEDDNESEDDEDKTDIAFPANPSPPTRASINRRSSSSPRKSQVDEEKLSNYSGFFSEFEEMHDISLRKSSSQSSTSSTELGLDENSNEVSHISKILRSDHKYIWLHESNECRNVYWDTIDDLRKHYFKVANRIQHVTPFVKIAYPDFALAYSLKPSEASLPNPDRSIAKSRVIGNISKIVQDLHRPKVIYSLDTLLKNKGGPSQFENSDEKDAGNFNAKVGLQFESRFESGNLRKVIQTGDREYDLMITSDVNSSRHNQWFYFQVSNTQNDKSYTFNVINCTKSNSLFNYGMQPVCFSVIEAMKGRPGWTRCGTNFCYFKNGYKTKTGGVYHTLSFNITFLHRGDIVYIAYHIPYTYTRLMVELKAMQTATEGKDDVMFKCDTLCKSLNGNQVPVITITSAAQKEDVKNREIIIVTSRVHPGETNASWVMKGVLEFLLFGKTHHHKTLLKKYVFKIVPMLNVEGVINGCHRCGLTAEDLNRCWKTPLEVFHPTIFHTKMLIEYCCRRLNKDPILYCDIHGHSRKKNVFFYGCSYNSDDHELQDYEETLTALPKSMERISPSFTLNLCNYIVQKNRETTARVAVWRDYNIARSYTLECSYCGTSQGTAFTTRDLMDIGKDLCKSCVYM